jgi:cytochrome c-type biogenesis protein CcmF
VSGGLLLAVWIAATTLFGLSNRVRASAGTTLLARLRSPARSYYGMVIAHLGVAVFVVGVTLVKGLGVEKDVRMEAGDTTELAGYVFRFAGVRGVRGPNYLAARATLEVSRNGVPVSVLHPAKRVYVVQRNLMTEAAIDTGFTRDLYVALGDSVSNSAWIVRVQHKPFVDWIWGGCLIMALGGALAISDRRYRIGTRRVATQALAVRAARALVH